MRTSIFLISRRGFTLVELLVGMTIFAVGMTAILAMLHAAISSSLRSREEIVVANLLREQVELVKNIRNTNLRSFAPWDKVLSVDPVEFTGGVFLIENTYTTDVANYTSNTSPVSIKRSTITDTGSLADIIKFGAARLYLDQKGRFTHDSIGNTETKYASYLILTPLSFLDGAGTWIDPKYSNNPVYPGNDRYQGYILDARVITKSGNQYRMYDLKTLITDWQK